MEDLDPPPALSVHPQTPLGSALISAFERDFSHLTVIDPQTKALEGYVSITELRKKLERGQVREEDSVQKAMLRFKKKGKAYRLITMETPLEELDDFFDGGHTGHREDFAVVTDPARRFVLGVATRGDLENFAKRRPA